MLLTAGVDEAGRGPLAGPVVAAAVILDLAKPILGLADSKVLSAARRVELASKIRDHAASWYIASASESEIDDINILHATMLAMRRAVLGLSTAPTLVLIDGNRCPDVPYPSKAIVKGDSLEACISAASILAKVERDRLMTQLDAEFPLYGFAQHKGYPTRQHMAALTLHGPCRVHRRSFGPVRRCLTEHASNPASTSRSA